MFNYKLICENPCSNHCPATLHTQVFLSLDLQLCTSWTSLFSKKLLAFLLFFFFFLLVCSVLVLVPCFLVLFCVFRFPHQKIRTETTTGRYLLRQLRLPPIYLIVSMTDSPHSPPSGAFYHITRSIDHALRWTAIAGIAIGGTVYILHCIIQAVYINRCDTWINTDTDPDTTWDNHLRYETQAPRVATVFMLVPLCAVIYRYALLGWVTTISTPAGVEILSISFPFVLSLRFTFFSLIPAIIRLVGWTCLTCGMLLIRTTLQCITYPISTWITLAFFRFVWHLRR